MADISKFQVYNDTLQLVNATMKSHKHFIREFRWRNESCAAHVRDHPLRRILRIHLLRDETGEFGGITFSRHQCV